MRGGNLKRHSWQYRLHDSKLKWFNALGVHLTSKNCGIEELWRLDYVGPSFTENMREMLNISSEKRTVSLARRFSY